MRDLAAPAGGRVETGPVRVGDDWPGVFIRGDEALAYADDLEHVRRVGLEPGFLESGSRLGALIKLLRSCKVERPKGGGRPPLNFDPGVGA